MNRRDDDVWPEEITTDDAAYEHLSESGDLQTILGTGGPARDDEVIRLTERSD